MFIEIKSGKDAITVRKERIKSFQVRTFKGYEEKPDRHVVQITIETSSPGLFGESSMDYLCDIEYQTREEANEAYRQFRGVMGLPDNDVFASQHKGA